MGCVPYVNVEELMKSDDLQIPKDGELGSFG